MATILEEQGRKAELKVLDKEIKKIGRKELPHILRVQQTIVKSVDEYMYKKGITRISPVMISPITDTLNHDVEDCGLTYEGQKFDITKSMIFHKQVILSSPYIDKIYIVSPNVRLEKEEKGDVRHLFEFTQVDLEFKNATMDTIFEFEEGLIKYIFDSIKESCAEEFKGLGIGTSHLDIIAPFKRYTTQELREKYGDDFEMEASKAAVQPFWLINHKREFYDAEDLENKGTYRNYDLIWPMGYVEGLSGGEREYKYDRILTRMRELDVDEHAFRNYIELAKQGKIPKTAGAGFGLERMTRFVCQQDQIDDVTVFTRKPGEKYLF
ncbi:asparagine synthetase A [Clostridium tyrobutyricum]|uniref:asparagine synthetase A n=1 Tax=Clostridium tyrobutyricum TaxID=1519 RepID=UPI001C393FA0|nr:asparagine synthetase A [Clostridium tyrobutyricum]MBV4426302.1 asparagine synthetase A [Clostridium tyrobutyricum]